MKKSITAIMLLSLPFSTIAESSFIAEALIGKSAHEVTSKSSTISKYNSSVDDNELALRLGYQYNENFTFELAYHDHGEATNKYEIRIPTPIPGSPDGSCCLGPDHDTIYNANIPLELVSVRLGVKGQLPIYENISINARFGIANWAFGEYSPKVFNQISTGKDDSGNDIYYGIGVDYQVSEDFYVGVEYSTLSIDENYQDENNSSGSYQYDVNDLSLVLGWKF